VTVVQKYGKCEGMWGNAWLVILTESQSWVPNSTSWSMQIFSRLSRNSRAKDKAVWKSLDSLFPISMTSCATHMHWQTLTATCFVKVLKEYSDLKHNKLHEDEENNLLIIQGDRKITQPIPDTYSICQKTNYTEIWKQKTMLYWVL
jgi:hypothetical protein